MDNTLLDVIGQALPLAVGVALSPFPLISVVLLLMSPRGRAAGAAFLGGRILGLIVMLGVIVAASELLYSVASGSGIPTVIRLLIGLALIVLGLSKWRPKPEGVEPKLPGWMNAIDGFSPARAFGLGLVLSITNPKELALAVPLGVTIGGAPLSTGETVIVMAIFVFVASISITVPVIALAVAPDRMRPALDRLRGWLTTNHSIVMGVLLLVIGAVVTGGAIGEF
jgi:threonine/homoserine/homoserine lactone efflux protein